MTRTPDPYRQTIGRLGAHASWANTVDRSARTRQARRRSPSSIEYWLDKLDDRFADATEAQRRDAAEAAKKAHYQRLALRSVAARRGGDRDGGNR